MRALSAHLRSCGARVAWPAHHALECGDLRLAINDAADQPIERYAFIEGARHYAGGTSDGHHLANLWRRQQVESRLVIFPDENHWILKGENSRYFYQEVHDWLGRWLQPAGG